MTTEKSDQGNDILAVAKVVAGQTLGGLNDFRKRYVGWIPFGAFWLHVYCAFQLLKGEDHTSWFAGVGVALMYMAGALVYSLVFFVVAALQFWTYRKKSSTSTMPAIAAMVLHGAALVFFCSSGLTWLGFLLFLT